MSFLRLKLVAGLLPLLAAAQDAVMLDASAVAKPFPHFWETMFGSGRAILSLRESYREDLKAVREITDFRYIRFHAILHDEVGVYNEDEHGNPVYNFAYVDQIYDGLLKHGVKPVVELSFMPKKLAFNPDALHPFWYKQNVSPPKSMAKWSGLMSALGRHLVDRYGVDEVASWYFEVWNEPNIDFWTGIPQQKSYFELYAAAARALKAVSPRLQVGGPATAAAGWVNDFLTYATVNKVPVDFVSSHGYADEQVQNFLGTDEEIGMDKRVFRAISKVHDQIRASSFPNLPLLWTEWNVPGMHELRDTSYVGPALANTIRQCHGIVDQMAFWTFSDVFEENGPIPKPFEGHFGLRAEWGINKPSFYDFALLHRLGNERIASDRDDMIVTRRSDGTLVLAAWNLTSPDHPTGPSKTLDLELRGVQPNSVARYNVVDDEHSNTLAAYRALGSPQYPTEEQVRKMNERTALPPASELRMSGRTLRLTLRPNALAVIEIPAAKNSTPPLN